MKVRARILADHDEAFRAGRDASRRGEPATVNPHDDWTLGVAWATGWHSRTRLTGDLEQQAIRAGWSGARIMGMIHG